VHRGGDLKPQNSKRAGKKPSQPAAVRGVDSVVNPEFVQRLYWLPKKNRTRKLNESVVILRGPWRGPKPLSKRAQAKANKKEPGVRGERWRRLLEDGVYESRAALSRGEGVSRAAVTRALGIT
jgi:hypothetical protein